MRKTFYVSTLWRTIIVQMFMQEVSALWSVRFRVSTLDKISSGTKFFVCLREVSALEDVRFREVPLYSADSTVGPI